MAYNIISGINIKGGNRWNTRDLNNIVSLY